jgi:hypothetical protein
LIAANETKYHQTEEGCPLTKGQLQKDIGLLGEGPQVHNIFNGTYRCPPGTNNATKEFLQKLKCSPLPQCCDPISLEDFKQGWLKTKERTSSCGLHFGHYKAAMQHPQIAKMLYYRALIPMQTGYSPKRLYGNRCHVAKKGKQLSGGFIENDSFIRFRSQYEL